MRTSLTPHSFRRLLSPPGASFPACWTFYQSTQAVIDAPLTVSTLVTPVRELGADLASTRQAIRGSSSAHGPSSHDSSTETCQVRPTHTIQDLHTMLLSFAQTAATSVKSCRASLPQPSLPEVQASTAAAAASAERGRDGEAALHSTLPGDPSSHPPAVMITPKLKRADSSAASSSERHFLHRLLLRRREGRRRARQTAGNRAMNDSGTASAVAKAATATPTVPTQAVWYSAFKLFSEAVQQHHVSPTAQHLNLLLYIAQQDALWGRVDYVEEFWVRLLSSVQQLRQEKMRHWRRVEEPEWRNKEGVEKDRTTPLPENLTSTLPPAQAPAASAIPPLFTTTPISSTRSTALMQQLDELAEMEKALIPNAQTYELLLASALARGMWSRALEYCEMRTSSGASAMTDASVRQVIQVYTIADVFGTDTRSTTDGRRCGLRAAARAQSRNTRTARGGPTQEPSWLAALHFFRNSLHRVSSMQTVWTMVTLLNRAGQQAELLRIMREDCQRLVQASLRSLAAHALTSLEKAAVLGTLEMTSDAACDLGDWHTALLLLHEVVELRHQLLPEHSALLKQLWGVPHPSEESGIDFSADARGDTSSAAQRRLTSQTPIQCIASPNQMEAKIADDVHLDEVRLSQHVLKNVLHTLRRVRRYLQMIDLYRSTSGALGGSVNGSVGLEGKEIQHESTRIWRSMWAPSGVGYVAQAALAVRDLDLLLELCGLTTDGKETVKEGTTATLDIPAEVYDATLQLIQYRIIQHRCEAESLMDVTTAATATAKGCSSPPLDVLSQRVYKSYRRRALGALAEEASPYHVYLHKTSRTLTGYGKDHTDVIRSTAERDSSAELDAPLLSPTHKPLVQLLAHSLQGDVDAAPLEATPVQQMLQHLQRIRRPDTLVIALSMDVLRTQACQRRVSDEQEQSLLVGIQQVLNTVLVEQHMEPIQLASASPLDASTCHVSIRAPRRRSPGLSYPKVVSELTPAHLISLSTITAAAAHMSVDALVRVQPLTLFTYIPTCVELAWLPSTAAPAPLRLAQEAVLQRAEKELRKDWRPYSEHHRAGMPHTTNPSASDIDCVDFAVYRRNAAAGDSGVAIDSSGRSAVAHFLQLYTQNTSCKTRLTASDRQTVLDAAAQVLVQLQRSRSCHPPTAAMSAFIEALRRAWAGKTSLDHGSPPRMESLLLKSEAELVVVTCLNAVVQQVSASTVGRWTMWGDCVDMLMTYINPPFSSTGRQEGKPEKVSATPETVRVFHMFIHLCDRAETGFVERVTMDWLLHNPCSTQSSRTGDGGGGGGCSQHDYVPREGAKPSETIDPVDRLRLRCLEAHEQLRCASSVPHECFTSLEMESMQLLLGGLVWACRRQAKTLARRLYSTLAPWLDVVLCDIALPPSSSTAAETAVLQQQLSGLRENALAACMSLAQCLSSGPRVEVLQDWPLQLRALRQLTDQGYGSALLSHLSNRRKVASLIDGIAAVVVKLRRAWCYLLNEAALDSHRSASAAHQRRSASSSQPLSQPPPPPLPAAVLLRRRNTEDSAASFSAWCGEELLPHLIIPCLRACVEHETRSDTTATTDPPTRVHTPSPRALVTAALRKILESIEKVDFATFVWQVKFRGRENMDEGRMCMQTVARLRTRCYQTLSTELALLNVDDASQQLVRHLHMWILFTIHSVPTAASAVTELCRDLVSLDAFHGIQVSTAGSAGSPTNTTWATPQSLLLLFVQEVDLLTEAKVTEALDSSRYSGIAAAATAAPPASSDGPSSHDMALPRMQDGLTAMEHLTKPLVHFTPSALRIMQKAAQWVMYLILCEGTVDVQSVANITVGGHTPSKLAPIPRHADGAVAAHAASSSSQLLHRCLAWTGQTHVYPALLHVVEISAHETLRRPEAVVSLLNHMERLGRAEECLDAAARDGEIHPDTTIRYCNPNPLDAFLVFYMHSITMRRVAPVSEQVCLAAVLACAVHTRISDNTAWLLPSDLLTLLTAFPHVVSDHLITMWLQGRLSPHQSTVLTEWMLRFVWSGFLPPSMDASPACLTRYGVGAAVATDKNNTLTTVTISLRRASMQWLLVTRGTIAPSPALPRERNVNSQPLVSGESPGPSQPPSADSAAEERIASLVDTLNSSCEYFAVRMGGTVAPSGAAAPPHENSIHRIIRETPLNEQQPGDPNSRSSLSLGVLARDVLQKLATRSVVQQLVDRYQCTNHYQHRPTRVEDTAVDVLMQSLPEDLQKESKAILRRGDDSAVPHKRDLATKASQWMVHSHAPPTAQIHPAASDERCAAALERWLDVALARLASEKSSLAPPPTPLPSLLLLPSQEEGFTWNTIYTQLLFITKNPHQCKDGTHASARASNNHQLLEAYTLCRSTTLTPVLLHLTSTCPRDFVSSEPETPLTSPCADEHVSVCVCSLLLLSYVIAPLQSLRPPPSLVEVSAVVRRELWRLLRVCHSAGVGRVSSLGASHQHSHNRYSALLHFCVRPLVIDALHQPCLTTSSNNQTRRTAYEATTYLVLLAHHVSAGVADIRLFSNTSADKGTTSAVGSGLARGTETSDTLASTARELLRLAEQELHDLHTGPASAAPLPEPLATLHGRLVRAWMQAAVLLGDARSLLWGGQRLVAWSVQKHQEATALAWIEEGGIAASDSTKPTSDAPETNAVTEWLCVLPVAMLVANVCSDTRGNNTGISEDLLSLAASLPLPTSISGAVAAEDYVNLLHHWQLLLQRSSCHSPFAVILNDIVPATATPALIDTMRRQVSEYLAGSAVLYPRQKEEQIKTLSCTGSPAAITAATLGEALQCVTNASEEDMRAFMRLEAAKRAHASEGIGRAAPKKAITLQAMWSLINRSALEWRQGCSIGSSTTDSWVSLMPRETWRLYILNLHPVVPHTVHFIPAAVTEVLILESCITWTDAVTVLEHSLGTLHRSGATPVQQYMAQLLLKRVRHAQQSCEGLKIADKEQKAHHFSAKLETYTYTVQQQKPTRSEYAGFPHWRLWSEHMARRSTCGTSALVCHIVDLLLTHHMQTTGTASHSRNTHPSPILAKHTLMEALRCGVDDPVMTRALFRIFWSEQYRRVEGVHTFLSALRAAKLARSDALALEAMLTYLWISDWHVDIVQREMKWATSVLCVIDDCEARATVEGPHSPSSLSPSCASAWKHLKVAARRAAEVQGPFHRFSSHAHCTMWKSWTALCRLQVVPKDVALCVVRLFKHFDRLTEVEELMVATCYGHGDGLPGEASQ